MVLQLQDLPDDVHLMILQFCDLEDALSYCSTCKSFSVLLENRIFWISVLERTRAWMPIPCPFHEDLITHSLSSLKKIALHNLRLRRNWDLPRPKVIGSIKAVELIHGQVKFDVLFQVPGTELYLLHSRQEGFVVCWDIGLGKAVTEPLRVSPNRILDVSPGRDEPGCFSMGLLLAEGGGAERRSSLAVICLQYDQSEISVSITFRHEFGTHQSYYWAVFMTIEIIGVLRCDSTVMDSPIDIIAFNLASKKMTKIETDITYQVPTPEGHSGTSSYDGDVFVIIEHYHSSFVYRCPSALLPTNENANCPFASTLKCREGCNTIAWDADELTEGDPFFWYNAEGALSADPSYGVPAVSVHNVLTDGQPPAMQVRFWTSSKHDANGSETTTLVPHLSPNLPGVLQHSPDSSWQLMLLPHSGRQILLVLNVGKPQPVIQLVRFHPETETCSVHELEIPSYIDVSLVYGLSLDDHRGVISLIDTRGVLYAIPYA